MKVIVQGVDVGTTAVSVLVSVAGTAVPVLVAETDVLVEVETGGSVFV